MFKFRLVAVTIVFTLALAAVPAALAAIPAPPAGPSAQAGGDGNVDYLSSHPIAHLAQQTQAYWTPEKLASAQPLPADTFERTQLQGVQPPETQPMANGAAMVADRVLPWEDDGWASVAYAVPGGNSETPNFTYPFAYNASLVDAEMHTWYPWSVSGKLFFTQLGTDYFCSGSVVTSGGSGNENLVLTAAHCLNAGGVGGTPGAYSTNVAFAPGYISLTYPHGLWAYSNLWLKTNWVNYGNDRQDYGFVVVNSNPGECGGQSVQDCLGAQGVAWNQTINRQFWVNGYPAGDPYGPPWYAGERMVYCAATTAKRDTSIPGAGTGNVGETPLAIGCDMTEGSSGGAWVIRSSITNGGFANSVTTYKYTTPSQPLAVYGPYFDGEFGSLWEAARLDFAP